MVWRPAWRKQYQEGSLTAVAAGEQVVPASELAAAMKQIKELQRLLGKKTMENELLKEAVEYERAKKWIAHAPLLPGDGLLWPILSVQLVCHGDDCHADRTTFFQLRNPGARIFGQQSSNPCPMDKQCPEVGIASFTYPQSLSALVPDQHKQRTPFRI